MGPVLRRWALVELGKPAETVRAWPYIIARLLHHPQQPMGAWLFLLFGGQIVMEQNQGWLA